MNLGCPECNESTSGFCPTHAPTEDLRQPPFVEVGPGGITAGTVDWYPIPSTCQRCGWTPLLVPGYPYLPNHGAIECLQAQVDKLREELDSLKLRVGGG